MDTAIEMVGFDADDTLWRSEDYFHAAQDEFEQILARHVDLADARVRERLYAVERGNIAVFGYGVKGMALSMVEAAVDITGGSIPARDLHRIVQIAKDMLRHPVELLPGVREAVEAGDVGAARGHLERYLQVYDDAVSLVVVDALRPADRLWAIEQTLRSANFGALLAWLPQAHTRPEHLRRLQSAAHGTTGPVFLFRELPAQLEPSPAPLRLLLLPLPADRLSVQILKRRGPVLGKPLSIELPRPDSALPLRHRPAEASARHPSTAPAGDLLPDRPGQHGALLN